MSVIYIERDGQRFALVPAEAYERMLDDLNDLDDIRAYDEAKAKPQEYVPGEIVRRLLDGDNPVKVWREHRKMIGRDLAKAADITPAYLSQLEHGDRKASQDVLRRLATALQVDIDDLVPSGA